MAAINPIATIKAINAGNALHAISKKGSPLTAEAANRLIPTGGVMNPTPSALLKVEVNILGDRYHDYLILMKRDNQWKIITKAFHRTRWKRR